MAHTHPEQSQLLADLVWAVLTRQASIYRVFDLFENDFRSPLLISLSRSGKTLGLRETIAFRALVSPQFLADG